MDDVVERMRALLAQDEANDDANVERSRALRLHQSLPRWLRRSFAQRTASPATAAGTAA